MTTYPDEMLMAYADGELSPEETRELEAWLAADPALRARLEPFMATRGSLAGVFDGVLRAPVPERLIAAVRAGATPTRQASWTAGRRAAPQSFLEAIRAALLPAGFGIGGMASAAALLLIGVGVGVAATRIGTGDEFGALVASDGQGHLVATGLLKQALASVPSEVSSGHGATIVTPVKTFRDHERHLCRQYELDAGGARLAGVACRGTDGAWRIALHSERAAGATASPGAYETAGTAEPPAVKAAVAAMIQGDPLSPDDEKALLAQGDKH